MVERVLRGTSFLEDLATTGRAGLQAGVAGLGFLGLQYINEHFLGNSMPIPPPSESNITFPQLSFYVADITFFGAAAFEGLRTAYNVLKIPIKAMRGRYSNKYRIVEK